MATKRNGKGWTPKKQWFSSSEAARYLDVSVDKVRELDESGEMRASRTKGKHRRFSRKTLDAYLARNGRRSRPRVQRPQPQPRPITRPEPDPEPFDDDAEDFEPGDEKFEPFIEPAPSPPPPPNRLEKFVREMEERRKREAAEAPQRRLATLKQYGLSQLPYGTPDSWRARLAIALESFVTLKTFPDWIDDTQAYAIVRGKVEEVLQPYREEVARKKAEEAAKEEEAREERRVQQLIEYGNRHASSEIPFQWDWHDRDRAARDVERMLKDSVEPHWSEQDVKDAVDDELEDWEGENIEDEEDNEEEEES